MDADLLSPLFLSRLQFAFVITVHILFPAFTIGLAHWLAFVEWRWLRTKDDLWRDLYFFWLKIFAVSFGMGVVSGIVMSFQFGTNWAVLSEKAGNILGPLLSYEVLTAFFLEAGFLGVMLFGWKKVSDRLHFFATLMVATRGPNTSVVNRGLQGVTSRMMQGPTKKPFLFFSGRSTRRRSRTSLQPWPCLRAIST